MSTPPPSKSSEGRKDQKRSLRSKIAIGAGCVLALCLGVPAFIAFRYPNIRRGAPRAAAEALKDRPLASVKSMSRSAIRQADQAFETEVSRTGRTPTLGICMARLDAQSEYVSKHEERIKEELKKSGKFPTLADVERKALAEYLSEQHKEIDSRKKDDYMKQVRAIWAEEFRKHKLEKETGRRKENENKRVEERNLRKKARGH